jgi:hypothetical protein
MKIFDIIDWILWPLVTITETLIPIKLPASASVPGPIH